MTSTRPITQPCQPPPSLNDQHSAITQPCQPPPPSLNDQHSANHSPVKPSPSLNDQHSANHRPQPCQASPSLTSHVTGPSGFPPVPPLQRDAVQSGIEPIQIHLLLDLTNSPTVFLPHFLSSFRFSLLPILFCVGPQSTSCRLHSP
ncbi:hypothetical protein ACOMHN_044624 [Nucella lapillus]